MPKIAAPLTERQAARIAAHGLLADEPDALLAAWSKVETFWAETVTEASRLHEHQLDQRVNGEWSFIETLRHLINVTDAWIGEVVLEQPSPYDPIGLPPDFFTPGPELGLDLDAHPSFAHVLDVRGGRLALARKAIRETPLDGLDRICSPFGDQFTVLGAFQNVIFEEWAHHYYATRISRLSAAHNARSGALLRAPNGIPEGVGSCQGVGAGELTAWSLRERVRASVWCWLVVLTHQRWSKCGGSSVPRHSFAGDV